MKYEEFEALRPSEKASLLEDGYGTLQSLIYTQQIDRKFLGNLIATADLIRSNWHNEGFRAALQGLLRGLSCALYFTQPSTRTFTSFSLAAQALGMVTEEIRNPDISSLYKGESDIDSLLTMAHLSDLIVLRQGDKSLISRLALELHNRGLPTRLINGGSGADQHPTQALLDIYTIISCLGVDKNTNRTYNVAMMGDLKHSRTVRSLSYMLSMFPNICQIFIAPENYQIGKDIIDHLTEFGIEHEFHSEKSAYIFHQVSCLYVVRIQDEYHEHPDSGTAVDFSGCKLSSEDKHYFLNGPIILHPLPRRDEIPVEFDSIPGARYWEAVERGKFIRMALILEMFDRGDEFWHKVQTGKLFGVK